MENWIGIGIWILIGCVMGLVMKVAIKRPEETPGHTPVLLALGAYAAVIGGMLGVGIFHLYEPLALSVGGMGGALAFSLLCVFLYRWGVRSMV